MSEYWLSKHVHLCLSGDQVVLLDLRRDEYSSYNALEASPLAKLVPGWPSVSSASHAVSAPADEDTLVDLLRNQIVTSDRSSGKEATPVCLQPALQEILTPRSVFDDYSRPRSAVYLSHRSAFLLAFVGVRTKFSLFKIEHLVSDVTHRRARYSRAPALDTQVLEDTASSTSATACAPVGALYLEKLRSLIASFRWLRPWAYSATDRCLFDSLVLIDYLAWFGLHPHWVFAVKTAPFTAHCWVQSGPYVLNDYLTHTREYTPILAA